MQEKTLLHFNAKDIEVQEKRFRTNFINSLTGFKSLALVGTQNAAGKTNLAPFSQIFHVGAHPPLLGMLVRPDVSQRHTLENIRETGFWTLNHVREAFFKEAHQCAARYPEEQSEFESTGLTPLLQEHFPAPFVAEAHIRLGLKLREEQKLEINGTHLLIGEIQEVVLPKNCLLDDGFVDIELAGTLTVSGLDSYHRTTRLKRLSYAKPDQELREL